MIKRTQLSEFHELLNNYQGGLYTRMDVIAKSRRLLYLSDERDQLWSEMQGWIAESIRELLNSVDENSEIVTFGSTAPLEMKNELLALKRWLLASH